MKLNTIFTETVEQSLKDVGGVNIKWLTIYNFKGFIISFDYLGKTYMFAMHGVDTKASQEHVSEWAKIHYERAIAHRYD